MRLLKNCFLAIVSLFLLLACSHQRNGQKPIARVLDNYLYPDDLQGLIKNSTSATDSILLVKNYINDWVRQKILVAKAEENIDIDKKELEQKINNYKESMLIYQYENELVKQKLDTTITTQQLAEFYNSHKEDFTLHNDIVRLTYIKIRSNSAALVSIKRMYNDPSINLLQIEEECKKNTQQFLLDESVWIATDIFPTTMQDLFPKTKGYIEQHDTAFTYLAQVKEFIAKGNAAPLNYVKEQVAKIIINRRKVLMIKNLHDDLFNDAFKKSEVEVF